MSGLGERLTKAIEFAKKNEPLKVSQDDDPIVEMRIAHTLQPLETLGMWYARTGVGREAALRLSPTELTAAVALSVERNKDDANAPAAAWQPKVSVPKFIQV